MIISNRFVRTYLFGSKVARIQNKSFQCCVSTAKEGWFQKQSTIILEPKIGNTVGAGAAGLRACAKLIYSPTLRTSDRLQAHDILVKMLDAAGEEGCTLEEALEKIFADWKRRGIAEETVNLTADQGQADAQFNSPYKGGLGILAEEAEQGDADAQFMLGNLYDTGAGVPRDLAQAAACFRKAAEQYRKAAEKGDAHAQAGLGDLYREGHGVPRDYTQAAFWLRKAAEQGDAEAQFSLGDLYYSGRGVSQDYTQAAAWFRKAAEQGYAAAQSMLGYLYLDGQGVPQDYAEAYFWYDLAAGKLDASDAEQVAKFRDEAASHLTPADQSRVQQRVRKWFEAHQAKPQ